MRTAPSPDATWGTRPTMRKCSASWRRRKTRRIGCFCSTSPCRITGGYDVLYDNYSQEIRLTGELEGKYPMADQYLSLMRTSDQALAWLLGLLEELEEPTMVVLFGDHQPSVEDEFYYEISGLDEKTVTSEESLIWYRTPYLIWTNYGLEKEELGDMSAYYLSGEVLRLAGLETTPYQNFLLEMRKLLPWFTGEAAWTGRASTAPLRR